MHRFIEEKLKTPVTLSCGTAVAGGGIAGISAALAAARHGADVLLIEREFAPGGLATLGLITCYLPICDGCGHQIIYGIGEELLRLSVRHGAERKPPEAWFAGGTAEEKAKHRFKTYFNASLFMLESEKLLKEAGVKILYGTSVCAAETSGEKITHLICENKSGRFAVAVRSVIDATGDADIAKFSGAGTELFGQGNILAGWYYRFSRGERKCVMVGAADIPEEDKPFRKGPELLFPGRFSGVDGTELSRMIELSHAATYADWEKKLTDDPDSVPEAITSIPQVRMTRRIAGRALLDTSDERRHFSDSVGLTGHWRKRGPVYEIPFGALCPEEVSNLLAAGRDISTTDAMWDVTRVIPVCAVTGEAAGTAAALFDDFRLDVRQIKALQSALHDAGVRTSLSEIDFD